jgi:hypothetical protein
MLTVTFILLPELSPQVAVSPPVAWHMLSTGKLYREPGGDYFERHRDPDREVKRLVTQLQRLGQHATVAPTPGTPTAA